MINHISKLLEELKKFDNLNQISQEMSSMEDIFKLQQMYGIKKEEEDIENELRKMGYIDWKKLLNEKFFDIF